MNSVWWKNVNAPRFPRLEKSICTDVLIIGAGMAGILCAHMLREAGVDCILVEARRICEGTTGNTTAKITLQHGLIYHKLIKQWGQERARLYLEAQKAACREYERLCGGVECNYEKKDSHVYSLDSPHKLMAEAEALRALGEDAELCSETELPFQVAGAVKVKEQAQFHPLRLAFELAGKLPLYENTKVLELMPRRAVTEQGDIRCKRIIVATHFPILNKHGAFFLKLYQHRSYVIALEGAESVGGMYVDEDDKGLSFRNSGDLLLLGGGGHRTGKNGGGWKELQEFAKRYYPSARITGKWATQDCMTLDGAPYIGQYSRSTPDMYVATGFNKWGMTSSMIASMMLRDEILGKDNPYKAIFSPQRSMMRAQLAVNALESVMGLLTPTAPRCPHLGCALKYNKEEHSWDCSCHGSRFSDSGELLDNPATDDMNK